MTRSLVRFAQSDLVATLTAIGAILSLGCDTEPTGPTTGFIHVSVATAGPPLNHDPDGYTLTVDGGIARPIGSNSALTIADLPPGNHVVQLDGLESNCSLVGTNRRSVDVIAVPTAASAAAVSFSVSCAPRTGTIRVSTTTTGEDQDPDGYSFFVEGSPSVSVPSNGTTSVTGVREGQWPVSIGGVSRNCSVDALASPGVSIAMGATAQVDFTIRCLPAGSLRVTTVTTGYDFHPMSGYDLGLTLVPGSQSTTAHIPTNGTVGLELLPGEYRLTLSSVFPDCEQASKNPKWAVVSAGSATAVTFEIMCQGPPRIAFVAGSGANADIYAAYSNNTGLSRLTTAAGADLDPAWSPDGSKIAFTTERDGNFEIYSMSSTGTNPLRLTQNSRSDSRPAWSPDGGRIAFVSLRDSNTEIYVMNADGTNQVRLTNNDTHDSDPAWSPDGTRIAFSSERDGSGIWIMNADGSGARRLTANPHGDYQPAWSPDGSRIAFSRGLSSSMRDIFFMSNDGSGVVPFTVGKDAMDPAWSPDGLNVVFGKLLCYEDWYYSGDYYCDNVLEIRSADGTRSLPFGGAGWTNPVYQP